MNRLVWNGNRIMSRVEKQAPKIAASLAKAVEATAKRLVPVDTGDLKATIRREGGTVTAGGGEVDYALPVELGTARRAAQPFMRPATEQLNESDVSKSIK